MNDPSPLLLQLLGSASPSGCEEEALAILEAHLSPWYEVTRDRLGNLRVTVAGKNPSVTLLVMAHADEIGLSVRHIDADGFIWFSRIGGVNTQTLPGAQVTIHTANGPVQGIIGVKPFHLSKREERAKMPDRDELFIDIGASSRADAGQAVECGDPITIVSPPVLLKGGLIAGRGLDDRSGCFVLAEALRLLATAGEPPPVNVLAVFSTQEEVGLRGAAVAARTAGAAIGICVETEHATDHPGMDRRIHGETALGKGPILPRGAGIHPLIHRHLRTAATAEGIPVQVADLAQFEGTEASIMQISADGMAAGLLMIPLRYMHSPAEVAALGDLEGAIRLLVAAIGTLDRADLKHTPPARQAARRTWEN